MLDGSTPGADQRRSNNHTCAEDREGGALPALLQSWRRWLATRTRRVEQRRSRQRRHQPEVNLKRERRVAEGEGTADGQRRKERRHADSRAPESGIAPLDRERARRAQQTGANPGEPEP